MPHRDSDKFHNKEEKTDDHRRSSVSGAVATQMQTCQVKLKLKGASPNAANERALMFDCLLRVSLGCTLFLELPSSLRGTLRSAHASDTDRGAARETRREAVCCFAVRGRRTQHAFASRDAQAQWHRREIALALRQVLQQKCPRSQRRGRALEIGHAGMKKLSNGHACF